MALKKPTSAEKATTKVQEEMYQRQQPLGHSSFKIGERVWVVEIDALRPIIERYQVTRQAVRVDSESLWQEAYHDQMPRILGAGVVVDYGKRDPRNVIVQWNSSLEARR